MKIYNKNKYHRRSAKFEINLCHLYQQIMVFSPLDLFYRSYSQMSVTFFFFWNWNFFNRFVWKWILSYFLYKSGNVGCLNIMPHKKNKIIFIFCIVYKWIIIKSDNFEKRIYYIKQKGVKISEINRRSARLKIHSSNIL